MKEFHPVTAISFVYISLTKDIINLQSCAYFKGLMKMKLLYKRAGNCMSCAKVTYWKLGQLNPLLLTHGTKKEYVWYFSFLFVTREKNEKSVFGPKGL